MSVLTDLTRMWLTRSTQPFRFTDSCAERFNYADCRNLGLYIHIPFCRSLCNFCPYCKVLYQKELADEYVQALIREIHLVGGFEPGRKAVSSLYFGGGTPSLVAEHLPQIIAAVEAHFSITEGIGLELHPENVTVEVLEQLKAAGVTKISIGIQSFQERLQGYLGRDAIDTTALATALTAVPFETVSMDFIFALPTQTLTDLVADIELARQCGANHVALYPFIDFSFTETKIPVLAKKEKRKLLDQVTEYCLSHGFRRNSIWTFAAESEASYSSMTRETFLGFGCSATTLLQRHFLINTFSVEEYCRRVNSGKVATALTLNFSLRQRMCYWLFWTAYSTRVDEADFEDFFGRKLNHYYGLEMRLAKLLGYVVEKDGVYTMTLKGAFDYHYYENFYTLSYIDKMWSLMSQEAFPKKLEF